MASTVCQISNFPFSSNIFSQQVAISSFVILKCNFKEVSAGRKYCISADFNQIISLRFLFAKYVIIHGWEIRVAS